MREREQKGLRQLDLCTEVLQIAGWSGLGGQQSDSGVKTWTKEWDWG